MSAPVTADRPTIFALSSGRPPAAIAVVRVSGPQARAALEALCKLPEPRRAALRRLREWICCNRIQTCLKYFQ